MRASVILLAMLGAACARELPSGVTELVYATPYGPGHPFSRADQAWMAFVEEHSGGTLRIRPSWSGALLSADQSMTELRHRIADVGLITPIYSRGGAHLIRIQSGFYSGVTTFGAQTALYRCMEASSPQFAAELDGLKVLAVQGGSLPGIVTRSRAVTSLEDLRGMRLRAPTELLSVLDDLGADPVNMPMGEVYSALAKGVLDGVVAPADTFRALHFTEVADYFTTLAIPRGAYPARAMSRRRWNELSPAHREVLEAGIAVWEAALAREIEDALTAGFEFALDEGIEILPIGNDDQRAFDDLYLAHAERNAAELAEFGIDGLSVFRIARASIGDNGEVSCSEPR